MTPTMTDHELLDAYVRTGSQEAFAEVVRRHVHLVHSAARRQTRGDAHLADDVTQAVFMVLARRAGTVSRRATVPGWLIRTTRYAALAALTARSRRRRHEQEAAAMARNESTRPDELATTADEGEGLTALLDEALARLPARDRVAVALRYLEAKTFGEVAAALGMSEAAARKRVGRALEKLRGRLAGRGVTSPAAALELVLADESARRAPAELVAAVTAPGFGAVAGTGAAAGPIAAAAGKALAAAHVKLVLAACAVAAVVAAGVAVPAVRYLRDPGLVPAPPPVARAPDSVTARAMLTARIVHMLGNSSNFRDRDVPGYHIFHAPGPHTAVVIKSVTPNPTQAFNEISLDADMVAGRHLRLTIWARTVDVRGGAIFRLAVNGPHYKPLVAVDTADHPIRGTTDWRQYHVDVDLPAGINVPVPPQADITLSVRAILRGSGELWTDDYSIDVVAPAGGPTTRPGRGQQTGDKPAKTAVQ